MTDRAGGTTIGVPGVEDEALVPTPEERYVSRQAWAGLCARFAEPTSIRGGFLRTLLLGLIPDPAGDATPIPRLWIRNALILGDMELSDAPGPSGPTLPALILEECRLEGWLRLTNARIRRIQLGNCQLRGIDATGCTVEQAVDCRGLSWIADDAALTIDFQNGRVGGQFLLADTRLVATEKPEEEEVHSRALSAVRYALDLRSCQVADHLILQPGVEIHGGLRLYSARVGGSVHADGLELIGGAEHALSAQHLDVAGDFTTSVARDGNGAPGFLRARGAIRFNSARIGGGLFLSGATIGDASDAPGGRATLDIRDARIETGIVLCIDGATSPHMNSGSVLISRSRINGPVFIGPSLVQGQLDATDASIVGDLLLSSERLEIGAVQLTDARIEGSVMLSGTIGEFGSDATVVEAAGMRVGGSVSVRRARVLGDVNLAYVEVGRSLTVHASRIDGHLLARPVRVRGSIAIEQTRVGGNSQIELAEIDGDVRIRTVAVPAGAWGRGTTFSLQDSRVRGELSVRDFSIGRDAFEAPTTGRFNHARRRRLACYPGWWLVEAIADATLIRELGGTASTMPDEEGVAAFLYRPRGLRPPDVVLLPGDSASIHDFNATGRLDLRRPRAPEDYLRLFTSYVWGDEGPFHLIRPGDPLLQYSNVDLSGMPAPTITKDPNGPGYRAEAAILYGDGLFRAVFSIALDGTIEMLDDEPLRIVEADPSKYLSPFRFASELTRALGIIFPPSLRDGRWRDLRKRSLERITPYLVGALRPPAPIVNLRDASADRLDDNDGRDWSGSFRLHADGFAYARAPRDMNPASGNPWSAQAQWSRIRAMQQRAALEAASLNATYLRRRRLHSHPHWWIVEIPTPLSVDESGRRLGAARLATGVARFLWCPKPGQGSRVIPLSGIGRNTGSFENVLASPGEGVTLTVDPVDLDPGQAARDRLCLEWAANPDRGLLRFVGHPPTDREGDAEGDGQPPEVRVVGFQYVETEAIRRGRRTISDTGQLMEETLADPVPSPALHRTSVGPYDLIRGEGVDPDPLVDSPWNGQEWEPLSFAESEIARRIRHEWVVEAKASFDLESTEPESGYQAPVRLRDRLGRWFSTQLNLRPNPRVDSRLAWIARQYDNERPTSVTYRPHPYEVAAAAFRNEGAIEDARRVLSRKLRLETAMERRGLVDRTRWLFSRLFGFFFDYGLSTTRALLTTLFLFVLGWAATAHLNERGLLVVDFDSASTIAVPVTDQTSSEAFEMGSMVVSTGTVVTLLPCGTNISAAVYAADLMVPILEFGQRHRCQIAGRRPPGVDEFWLSPDLWKLLQTGYAILGAVCVSIMILTVSGVLRRHAES